jgi:hypothetical protein
LSNYVPAQQVKPTLLNNGVKAEELKHMGLDEFLERENESLKTGTARPHAAEQHSGKGCDEGKKRQIFRVTVEQISARLEELKQLRVDSNGANLQGAARMRTRTIRSEEQIRDWPTASR